MNSQRPNPANFPKICPKHNTMPEADKIRIYISFDPNTDIETAEGVYQYLNKQLESKDLEFWNPTEVAEENYRTDALAFLEQTQLFLACFSPNYLDSANTRWELDLAISEQKRRPELQILVTIARAAPLPAVLEGFPIAPATDQPVEGFSLSREIQLQRVVQRAQDLLFQVERSQSLFEEPAGPEFVLHFEDVRERLIVWLEHCDLAPLFLFLKRLLHPEKTPDALFQLEDAFAEWRQQSQRNKLSFEVFQKTVAAIRLDLRHLIEQLEVEQFRKTWAGIFANTYYGLQPVEAPADKLAGLFLPISEILIPKTLNLPDHSITDEAWEGVGTLSVQQQQEFRRNLLLAQDAIGIGNFSRAHAHCEHVRSHIDPQSAQLYELLLISYLKKETPDRIVHDAVYGKGSKLNHVVVYAGRFSEYQQQGKCPTEAGRYNLRATAEALSDALLRLYNTYQNDYILHTGRYSSEVPDNRAAISHCVQVAMEIYRTVHPYRGFLELAANELCNGGKYDYIRQVEIIGDEFRFASHEDFGIESEIRELIGMLEAISDEDDDALMNKQLRENLFFNLKAKRHRLQSQIAEEQRRYIQFTDLRDSVIELVQASLLGYKIFGDKLYPDHESFLRLAIEQLLPGLLLPTASGTPANAVGNLRWFILDAFGAVSAHPDCAKYRFEVLKVVEKIVKDHAGHAGWLQVQPNIKSEVYKQFAADAEAKYLDIRDQLKWTDIRRPNETDARRTIIQVLQAWESAYHAYPERGQAFLQHILFELAGERLLLWMHFNPTQLNTVSESLGLGYDARKTFKKILELPSGLETEEAYKLLATNIFNRKIKPEYEKVLAGDEGQRSKVESLLLQALHIYRDLYAAPEFLDFVFEELTNERKFRWIQISMEGNPEPAPCEPPLSLDPPDILRQLAATLPKRFRLLEARTRIAERRFKDLTTQYLREVSEYTYENRLEERRLTIEIIRKLKGLFLYYPEARYLELPIRELEGHGRIRWREKFLGIFPTGSNHYENRYFGFDYSQELSEFRMFRDTRQQWMEHVLRQTGDLT